MLILRRMLPAIAGIACCATGWAQVNGNLPQTMPNNKFVMPPTNQQEYLPGTGTQPGIKRTLRTEGGGFQWYSLKSRNGAMGAQDAYGNTIIPLERGYTSVEFKFEGGYTGFFQVRKRHFYGACDVAGREVVPPTSDFIVFHTADGFLVKQGKEYVTIGWKLSPDGLAYSLEDNEDGTPKTLQPTPGLPDLSAGKALLEPTSTGGTPSVIPPTAGSKGGKSGRTKGTRKGKR